MAAGSEQDLASGYAAQHNPEPMTPVRRLLSRSRQLIRDNPLVAIAGVAAMAVALAIVTRE